MIGEFWQVEASRAFEDFSSWMSAINEEDDDNDNDNEKETGRIICMKDEG